MLTPADRSRVLGEVIRFQARRTPDAPAHWFNDVSTSYAQLDRYANQVAHGLKSAGLKPAERIAYLGKNSDVYFELLFGSARAGTVLVGLNWRLAAAEIAFILHDAEVRWLFVEEEFLPTAQACLSGCAGIEKVIPCSGAGDACYHAWRDGQPDADPGIEVHDADVVVQMHTSGTTGRPKGVQITHRCFFAQMRAATESGDWAQWRESDVSLLAMPTFHIGGTMWGFTAFYQGSCNVILPVAQVAEITQAIEKHRITRMFIVPTLLMMISDAARSQKTDFSSMRVILYGASPIPEDVLERSIALFDRASFVQQYGMTETAGAVSVLRPQDHVRGGRRITSCGRAYPGVQIRIVSREGKELAPGEVGEILIKTEAIMKGYWNQEAATAEVLRDGWYHSGDAGCLDEEGFLYIRDRIKDMIVSGGENVYPAEIESVLHRHEGVQDVAVIGAPHPKWGEAVKAVVVRRAGASPDEKELIEFARRHLAGYKLPKSIEFVEELPRNASGKLLKHVLRKQTGERADTQRDRVPVKTGLFTWPAEQPELLGSRCGSCGEAAFPAKSVCMHCGSDDCREESLGCRGRLWTWTIQGFKPKPPYRSDQRDDEFTPYGVGYVELDSRIRIESRLTVADPASLRIGMPMRLVVEKLYGDAARDYMCFAFEPDRDAAMKESD